MRPFLPGRPHGVGGEIELWPVVKSRPAPRRRSGRHGGFVPRPPCHPSFFTRVDHRRIGRCCGARRRPPSPVLTRLAGVGKSVAKPKPRQRVEFSWSAKPQLHQDRKRSRDPHCRSRHPLRRSRCSPVGNRHRSGRAGRALGSLSACSLADRRHVATCFRALCPRALSFSVKVIDARGYTVIDAGSNALTDAPRTENGLMRIDLPSAADLPSFTGSFGAALIARCSKRF